MKLRDLFWCLIFIITSCSDANVAGKNQKGDTTENKKQKNVALVKEGDHLFDTASMNGILILNAGEAQSNNHTFKILNIDQSPFAEISSAGGEEPASPEIAGKILTYYPDYYVIHFNAAESADSFYYVKIASDIKLIKKDKYLKYLSWPEYVLNFFCTTTKENPLRRRPEDSSITVKGVNYEELSFRCFEISGDWVKLICNSDCEGCPESNKPISGWIRWRLNGKVILNQHYAC